MFHVGQLVVCVDDNPTSYTWGPNTDMDGLAKGTVYTIRAVGLDKFWHLPVVWLVEIQRQIVEGMEDFGEIGYSVGRFRPVQDSALDIFRKTEATVPENA